MEEKEIYLTRMETKILDLFADGKDKDKVKEILEISAPTLNTHLGNIYQKLCLEGKDQLLRAVLWYIKNYWKG
jgi:DNA-binding CsgD family transcriptional regulator